MGDELSTIAHKVSLFRKLLEDKTAIGVLLYLGKYNPDVSVHDIEKKFGKDGKLIVDYLRDIEIVKIDENGVTLTDYGIFQVSGLVSVANS